MNKQSLQNIWAVTDKQAMDMMAKRTYKSPSTDMVHDSTDDDSDLESLDSRYGPFVAVPKEFRPPLQIHTKIEHSKLSLNEKKQVLSNQISTPEKELPKISHMEHPKLVSLETKRISNQNEALPLKKNLNPPQHTETLQKCPQVVSRNKANVNDKPPNESIKKTGNKGFQKRNMIHRKVIQEHKKEIKYEYVGKREHRTVEFSFEMPTNSKLFYKDGVERGFGRGFHRVSYEENTVKWVEASNIDEEKSYAEIRTKRNFNKNPAEKNAVKWVESFGVDEQNTKSNIERNPGNFRHKISYQETVVKRDSSSNPDESSSDSECKIRWRVIPEKKICVSTEKRNTKNYTHKQSNKYFSKIPGAQNKVIKHRGHSKNNHHKNNMTTSHINNQNDNPKPHSPRCKDTPQLFHKNDFAENNKLKYDNSKNRNSDRENECHIFAETFNQQCRISGKIMDNQKTNENLLNSEPELTLNSNQRKKTYNQESNVFPVKIDNITLKNVEDKKKTMLYYGREMCDLILGSYSSLTVFISMFNEWKNSRVELINHFENLVTNLKESSKKFARYKDMLDFAKTGATFAAAAVPMPHVSIAAKIISVLTGLFSAFLSNSDKKKAEVEDSNDISIAACRDASASNELYIYALQCGQQFEETAKLIEEFHSNVCDAVIFEYDSPEIATFIRGVLEYRPAHRIFYKKLHKCFQELIHNSTSEFGKRFCEPFLLDQPEAVDVIGFLEWRFRHEDFNGESVRFELEQIQHLMQSNDTEVKEFVVRIQNCIRFLQDELKFLEGCIKHISQISMG